MGNIRLFFSNPITNGMTGMLDKSQSHYLNKVMRIKENEFFSLFNNKGEWEAKILKISKGLVEFEIIKQLRQKENMKDLWLAFSPIKSNYQNFMIQKATELGVTKFLPIIFERTIVRSINVERLKKIAIETVDITGIGFYSLGKHRKSLSDEKKSEYQKVFREYFLKSFSSRLAEYSNPVIEVNSKEKINENYLKNENNFY